MHMNWYVLERKELNFHLHFIQTWECMIITILGTETKSNRGVLYTSYNVDFEINYFGFLTSNIESTIGHDTLNFVGIAIFVKILTV